MVATDWIKDVMRRAMALLIVCALFFALMIIAATHGPGLPVANAQITDDVFHGHSHDDPEPGQFGFGHDATDHEHLTQELLLAQTTDIVSSYGELCLVISHVTAASLSPPSLRRPPKIVFV